MKTRHTSIYLLLVCLCAAGLRGMAQTNNQGSIEILQQPVFKPVCAGENGSLSVQASGGGLSYQWQVFKREGNYEDVQDAQGYSGSQTPVLNIAGISKSMNLYSYRCRISNSAGEQFTRPAGIVLKNAIINYQPANGATYAGEYHSLEVYATGEGLLFQWQVDKGSGFSDVEDDDTYKGSKTSILSIPAVAKKMEDYQYRCIVSGHSCENVTLYSNPAALTVSTGQNPMKAKLLGNPNEVIWYMQGFTGAEAVVFKGDPIIYVEGAVQFDNNSQITFIENTGPVDNGIMMTGHLKNNNTTSPLFTAGDVSKIIFAGSDAQEIQGGSATLNNFYNIKIEKSANTDKLTLLNDISFRKNLTFANGDLDLNGKKTFLTFVDNNLAPVTLETGNAANFPTIITESETNRILGTSATSAVTIAGQNIDLANPLVAGMNLGNLGAEIKDPSNVFQNKQITIERQHTTSASGGTNSIQRLYKISSNPEPPVPANIEFTFRYLDGDHTLNATDENTLKLFKSDNSGTSWAAQTTDVLNTTSNFAKQNSVPDITTWWRLFPCLNTPVPTFTEGTSKHLCNGTAYTITPNITGGVPPFTYSWLLNGAEVATTATYSVTGVAGTANQTLVFKVFNAAGCFNSATLTLIHEPALSIDLGPDQQVCKGPTILNSVSIANATNYEWRVDGNIVQSGLTNSYSFNTNNFAAGPHVIQVTASTQYCSVVDTKTITINPLPTANLGPDLVICAPGTTTLNANPASGTPAYGFNWSNGASTQTTTVTNADATYSVTVTDSKTCSGTDAIQISFSNFTLSETHQNIKCFGELTGSIDLSVSGEFNPTLLYNWGAGQPTTQDRTGLAAGTYNVTVTDGLLCTKTLSVTLTQPAAALALTNTITQVQCNGQSNGEIDLTVSGGVAPYTYNWGAGQPTTQDRTGLAAGTYNVTVTDANLCTKTGSFIVTQPAVLTASTAPAPLVTHVSCFGAANGAIAWTIIGGTTPYTFSWTRVGGGYTSTAEDPVNLSGGTYNVTVTDAHLCTYTASFVVDEPAALAADITPFNVACLGTSSGQIITSTSGGTLPYSFSWTGPGGYIASDESIFTLASGAYNVTITDAHGCILTPAAITIFEPPSALSVAATVSQITCFGANNGFINVTPSGGWGGYIYFWSGPNFNSNAQNVNSLAPGVYNLAVYDANNCLFFNSFTITEPDEIFLNAGVFNITCHDDNNGSITLNVSGGTGAYVYNWQWAGGSSTASSLSNLAGGTYSLTVTDANLCTKTSLFTITNPAVISATASVFNVSCFGYSNGGIYLTPSGGFISDGDYFYTWTGPNGFTATTQNISFLAPGVYTVSITDFNSCPPFVGTYTITQPTQLLANPIITIPLACFGSTNGQINANPSGGTPPYNFSWTGPNGFTASTQFISNLSLTGTYTIYITDANGCHSPGEGTEIALTSPPEIIATGDITHVTINGGSNGEIDLTVSGGVSPYTYLWSNGATTQDISGLTAGNYTVTVTDDNDCIKTATFMVEQPGALNIAVEVLANVSCNGGNDGFIVSYATGGVGPFTFNWSNGETTFQINNLAAGSYTLTLTDANGSTDVETFTITQPAPILPNAVQVNVSCFGANDGSITLAPTGGNSTYNYNWSNSSPSNPLINLAPGTFSVTITDGNNCQATASYTITEPSLLTAGSVATNASCYGYNDGNIELTASGGTLPYSYNWDNGFATGSGSGTSIPNLYAGTYSVTLTDDHDCTATTNATITEPPSLNVSISGNQYLCAGETSVLDAGTGFTDYDWSTGATTQTISVTAAGIYSVTVTNASGCTESDEHQVFVFALPTLVLNSTLCAPDLLSYSVEITSNTSNVSANFGTVTNNGNGTYTISGVPAGQNVTITVSGGDPPCQNVLVVTAPNCACPLVNPPLSGGNQSICVGATIPALTVTVGANETADWYDAATGGTLLLSGNTSYTPTAAGTYYAEARNTSNGCVSTTRTAVTLTINSLPIAAAGGDVPICAGSSTTLNANGSSGAAPLAYLWSPAAGLSNPNIVNPVASPTATTTYTVLVTDANACSASDMVVVTVNSVPVANAGADVALCAGANTQLDAGSSSGNGTLNFAWSPTAGLSNPNIANPLANPLGTTTYVVLVTDGNGCTASDGVVVTVNPLPTLTLTSTTCAPDLLTYDVLVASNADQLAADFGTVVNNGNGTFNINGVPAAQNVTLTATITATACQKILVVTAPNCACPLVNPPVSNGNQTICAGSVIPALTVTVGANETADWYSAASGGVLLLSGNTSYTPTAPGTYFAEARNTGNNCVSSTRTALSLIINPLPLANAGADVAICAGTGAPLNANASSGSGTLIYLWSPAAGLSNPNIVNPVANPAATTTYTVLVTDANTCSASDAVVVTVNPLPVANAGADVALCAGANAQLNAGSSSGSGTLSYAWSPVAGLNDPTIVNPVASPTATTTYTLTVTDGNGCTAADGVVVTVNPLPTLTLTNATCAPDLLTYNVLVTSNANQLTANFGTVVNNGNGTFNISGVPASQNLTLTATITATGCQKILVVTAPNCACPVVNAPVSGGNQTICANIPIPALTVTVGANETADWYSAASGGTLLLSGNTSYTPTAAGTYYAEARNTISNCVSSTRTALVLTIHPLPVANAGADVAICAGANTTLNAGSSSGSGTLSYVWSPAASLNNANIVNPVASPTATTTYTVIVTDGNTCSASDGVIVTVNPLPTLTIVNALCAANLLTYNVSLTSNGTVTATAGTVTNNGGGSFTVSGVPAGQNVTVTATLTATGCQTSQVVTAPNCACPAVNAPVSGGNQTICANSPIPALTVTVNANETADWYSAPTGGTLLQQGSTNYTPTAAGTFYAEARNTTNNCVSSTRTAVVITINPLPLANAGADVSLCAGANTQLNAGSSSGNGTLSFAWSPAAGLSNANIVNPVASPTATTTYTVLVTDGNTCSASDQVVVTVNPLPTLTISSATCAPNLLTYSVSLTSNGTVTASAGTVTNNGGNSYTVSGVPTGQNVAVTATFTSTGCQTAQVVTAPNCACPAVNAPVSGGNATICANIPIPVLTVTVNANETADWYSAPTGGVLLLSGNTSYTPAAAGTYYAEARNTTNNCVSSTRTAVVITINLLPLANAGADVSLCVGANTQLNAGSSSGNGTLIFAWSPAAGLSNANIVNPVASPTATTTYTVLVTDGNGCTASDGVVVTVNPLPTLTISSAACAPNLLTYSVSLTSNGTTVTASAGTVTNNGGGSFTVSGVPSGQNVTVTATFTATSCQTSQVVTAPNCACPVVNAPVSGGNAIICASSPIPALTVTVNANETTDWYSAPTGGALLQQGSTSYTPAGAGTFYAEARNTINNCVSSTRTAVVITINPLPLANAGADVAICAGANTQLNAGNSSGSGTLSYAWSPAAGLSNANIVNPVASPSATTTYTVTVTDGNGCTATDGVLVTVNPLPTLTIVNALCAANLLTYSVSLTSNGTVTATSGTVTNNGGGSFTVSGVPAGQNVTVTATFTATGCQTAQVVNAPNCACPVVNAPVSGGNQAVCASSPIPALTVTVGANETADWYNAPSGGNLLAQGEINFTPTAAGTFYAEARNTTNNCVSSTRTAVVLTINPLPVANAGADVAICAGANAQLNAGSSSGNGTLSFAWSPAASLSNPNIVNPVASPTTSTTYTVTVTDGNTCSASDGVVVTVNPLPTLAIVNTACAPDLLTYSVSLTSNGTVTATDGTVTNIGGGSFTVSGVPAGQNVTVTATFTATGCQTAQVVTAPNCACPVVNAPVSGGNATICASSPIPALTVTVGANETADWYSASTGGTLLLTGSTSYTPSPSGVGGSTFYAEARNTINNCVSSTRTAVVITINPLPLANAGVDVAICAGANTQLNAGSSTGNGTLNYAWSPATGLSNPNIANPVASPTATTTYTVTVTDGNTCSASDQIIVTVNPLPTLAIVNAVCAPDLLTYNVLLTSNGTVTATAGTVTNNGGGSYTVSGVPAGQNVTVTATFTATGCQTAQVVNAPNCACPAVNAPLSGGNATICANSPIPALTVTVGANETADWYSAPSGGNLLAQGEINFTPTAAGTYYAEARNTTNNCVSSTRTAVVLTINPLPLANAGADVAICVGANTQLNAGNSSGSGTLSYQWSPAAGLSNPNIVNPLANPTATTTYTVMVTDGNGCSASDQVLVTVNSLPSANAGADVAICFGLNTQLNGSGSTGNGTLSFLWTPAAGLSNPNIVNPLASPSATTIYSLSITDGNGCTATDGVLVTIHALPLTNAGADVAICAGGSTTLNAGGSSGNGALTFLWSPATGLSAVNIPNPIANPAGTTTYTVVVTDGNTCTSSDQVQVTVNSLPLANAGADVSICASASTTLNASGSSGSGILNYLWSPATGLSNANIVNPVASPSATTTYTVLVTDGNTCSASDQVTVTVNPLPTLAIVNAACAPDLLTYSVSLTSNGTTVTATAGTVTNNGGGSFTVSGVPAGQNVTVTATLTATGCQTSQVVIAPNCACPAVNAPVSGGNASICANIPIPALTVTVGANETADWYDAPTGGNLLAQGEINFTPTAAGTFYAEARNTINNCVSSTRTAVVLTINPLPLANAGADVSICASANTQLNAGNSSGSGTLSYQWSPAAGLSNANIVNPVASPTATTTYTVLVTDGNTCSASDQVVVTVNPLPTLAIVNAACAPDLLTYSVSLTSNGTVTVTAGTVTNNGGGSYTVSGVPAGQNVTVTANFTATGCQTSQVVTAPNCACPAVNAPGSGGNQAACANSPIPALTVTVGANETADWYDAPTGGNLLAQGEINFTPTAAGTYYAEARNSINNCVSSSRTAIVLTINPLPVANAGADVAICAGANTQLNAGNSSGSGTLSYQWSPAAGLSNPNIVNPLASPTATTTYTVTVTDGNTCSASDQILVTVNPLPTLTIDNTLCAANLLTYSVSLTSNGTVTASAGTVTNNGGGSYTVSGVPAGQNVTVTATLTSTGCQTAQVVTAPNCACPVVNAPVSGGNASICANIPIPALTVTVGANETADWYNAPSGGTLLLAGNTSYTPAAAGTFYAEARNTINNCVSSTRPAVVLTINPLPLANAGADVSICAGTSTQLNASGSSGSGSLTYLWSPATGLSNPNIVNPIASPTTTTTYTVTVTDGNACSSTDQVTVTVNLLPSLTVNSATCAPNLLTYSVEGSFSGNTVTATAGTVTLLPGGAFTVSGVPAGQNITLTASFTASGCQVSQVVTAPNCSCPVVAAPVSGGNQQVCLGNPLPALTVSVNANETADWYNAPSGGILLQQGSTGYTPAAAGTYYAEARNLINNCISSSRTAITLTINSLPLANAGADLTICSGNSTTLNASASTGSGILSYLWSPATGLSAANIPNPIASPLVTTTYSVLVTDGNGCTATDQLVITVNLLPTLIISGTACAPNLLTYSVLLNSNGSVTASLGTVTNNGGGSFTVSGVPTGQNVTVTSTLVSTGCQRQQLVASPLCPCPVVSAPLSGGDQFVCANVFPIPVLTVTVGTNETADWYDAAFGGNLLVLGEINFTPTAAGTYYAEARSLINNCVSGTRTPVTLTIYSVPVANAGADVAICFGTNTTLNASGSTGLPPLSFLWTPTTGLSNPNVANPVANPSATTTYTVIVTNGNGCTESDNVLVTVHPLPLANAGTDVAICTGSSTVLNAGNSSGSGTLAFAWTPGTGLSTTNIANPTANPSATTTYTVNVTDGNGCTATDQALVTVNPLPVITVNNVLCDANLVEYHVFLTTNANVVTSTGGTVYDLGGGSFIVGIVPNAQNITISASFSATGCSVQQGVNAPNCSCPTVNAPVSGGNQTICFGQSIPALTVTVGSGETAAWYDAPTGGNLIISGVTSYTPSAAGTFYVEAVNTSNNCSSAVRTAVTLTINTLPVANAGADVTICTGFSVYLDASGSTGSGGLAFVWTPATGLSNPNIVNPVANPSSTTTYTVKATDGAGCSSTDQVLVSVSLPPTLAVNLPVCSPNLLTYAVDISTNGNNVTASLGTVTNNGGGAYSINGIPAGQNLILTITNTGTSCVLSQSVTAPVCNCPFVAAPLSNGNEEICEGETIQVLSVLVNPGETADWYDAPTGGNLLLANNTEYLPTAAGTFYAQARNLVNNCTSSRVALSLTIHPLPTLVFDDPADLCADSSPIGLLATPAGGTFSGTGVFGNQFDASTAGAGVHDLTYSLTDGNGCTAIAQQNIEVFPLPSVSASSNSPVCDGGDLLLMQTNVNAIAWSWTGPNGFMSTEQNPVIPMLTANGAGVYQVTASNAQGCTNSASITVSLNPALGLNLDPTAAAFCPGSNVQLAALPTGGNGVFDYVWTNPSGGNESSQAVLADEAGAWSVVVTDGSGCTISGSIAVAELPAIAVNFASTNASCNGSDGTLTATVSGGLAPFSYEWDGFPNTTNMLTGLPAGGYQVIVTDANGCVFSATGFVGNTNAPTLALNSIVNVLCAGAATGSITINVSGGSAPYSFDWTNGGVTQNISSLAAGSYGLAVTDAAGCIVNEVWQVSEPPALAGVLVASQTSTPLTGDGAINLTVSGGVAPYQFAWSNGLSSEDISNLFIGPYSVTVTDANGCSVVESTVVTAVGALTVNVAGQNISCNGLGDGSAEAIISGGFMPYTILWSTGSNLPVIDNLLPGSYSVTVTDQNGIASMGSVTLTQPSLLQAFTQTTDNVCNGGNAGAANMFPSGGTLPYAFEWSNGETTQAITGIAAGDYTVTITDANGCTNEQSVTVDEPAAMQIAIDAVTDNVCFGEMEGAIDISVSGGAFPYFAAWSSGASTQDLSGLQAGTYTVTITDFQACTATADVSVGEAPQIVIDFDNTGVVCFGEANGSLTANVAGGTPGAGGYQFNWTNGQTTASIGNLISDNYFVTVTDEAGCTAVSNDFVAQPALLLGNLTVENVTCFSLADGTAEVQPTGGTLPYTYLWNNAAVDSFLEDLDAGAYSVVITDASGCTVSESLQITQPAVLAATAAVTDLNCFNDFSGAINLTITGGTPLPTGKYITSWSSGQASEDIDVLEAGDYSVTVVDDNGCQIEQPFSVAQPAAIVVDAIVDHVNCFGGNDGIIVLTASGGSAPFVFNWQNGVTTPGIGGLGIGSYPVTVTDNHGCEVSSTIEITQPDFLSMDFQIQRAGCKTTDDGSINITVQGGVPDYAFNWSNGAVTEDASQLTAGMYNVTATDANGCTVVQLLAVAATDGTFEAYFLAASGLFDVDSVEVNSDDIIQFVDVSHPLPVSWQWFFGDPDNITSNLPNPAFSYPNDPAVHQSPYFATLIASNLFCTDTMTKRIWITNNMRLIEPEEDSLVYLKFTEMLAYPNPTTDIVNLRVTLSREENVRLYVVDVVGQILEQKELEGDDHYETKLDFTGWTPGLYFIYLRSVNQVRTVKVVVSDR